MPAIGWPSINAHTIATPQHRTAHHTIRYTARSFLTAVVLQRFAIFSAQFFMCPLLCLVSRPTRRHCRYSHAFFKTSLTSAACAAVSCFARHTRSRINTQTIKLVPILEFNRIVHIWTLDARLLHFRQGSGLLFLSPSKTATRANACTSICYCHRHRLYFQSCIRYGCADLHAILFGFCIVLHF